MWITYSLHKVENMGQVLKLVHKGMQDVIIIWPVVTQTGKQGASETVLWFVSIYESLLTEGSWEILHCV